METLDKDTQISVDQVAKAVHAKPMLLENSIQAFETLKSELGMALTDCYK